MKQDRVSSYLLVNQHSNLVKECLKQIAPLTLEEVLDFIIQSDHIRSFELFEYFDFKASFVYAYEKALQNPHDDCIVATY